MESVVYCLEILQRLVRDSRFIMIKVYNLEGLIKNIIEFFVPQVLSTGNIFSFLIKNFIFIYNICS